MHNDPALGGYTGWSFLSIGQLQVPGCYKHDNPALGGYIIWSIQFLLVTGVNNMDFVKRGGIYIEASLKPSLCSAQDLGATGNMDIREKYLPIFSFELIRLTRRWQQSWTGAGNNHNPTSSIIMNRHWQQSWTGAGNNHDPELSVFITRRFWKS